MLSLTCTVKPFYLLQLSSCVYTKFRVGFGFFIYLKCDLFCCFFDLLYCKIMLLMHAAKNKWKWNWYTQLMRKLDSIWADQTRGHGHTAWNKKLQGLDNCCKTPCCLLRDNSSSPEMFTWKFVNTINSFVEPFSRGFEEDVTKGIACTYTAFISMYIYIEGYLHKECNI